MNNALLLLAWNPTSEVVPFLLQFPVSYVRGPHLVRTQDFAPLLRREKAGWLHGTLGKTLVGAFGRVGGVCASPIGELPCQSVDRAGHVRPVWHR